MNELKFNLMDQQWTIQKVPSHDATLYVANAACTGTMWAAKQAIYVSEELSPQRAWRTIVHELCHAYIVATQAIVPESWSEEDVCELFAIYASEIVNKASELFIHMYGGATHDPSHPSV